MNSSILGLKVAGLIFGLMCLMQFLRLVTGVEVMVGGHLIPFWASVIAFLVMGFLSLWLWRLSRPAMTHLT